MIYGKAGFIQDHGQRCSDVAKTTAEVRRGRAGL